MMMIVAARAHSIDISAVLTNLIASVAIVGLLNLIGVGGAIAATRVTG